MNNKLRTNPYRLAIQTGILAIIIYLLIKVLLSSSYVADFEAYCPFGGLMAFSSFLVNKSLACSMTSVQIAMGGIMILGIIIFSKLFCSFICPVGTLSEWIGKAGEKLKVRFTITGYADLLLRGIKYAILFLTVYYTISSSELFCRKFDPYYAAVTGFGGDVSFAWGLLAIIAVVAGSFFVRLFWCKYLCPVGAISNIFRFFITFILVTTGYILLRITGITISFVWPLALICLIAYLLEFYNLRSAVFPLMRIKRHPDICTNCKLCDKYCPMAIKVESVSDVKHIDCHLCGDCIHVCPEKGALTINKKGKKWLPALITILLIAGGILIGKTFEIPTLSLYWGDKDEKEQMVQYSRSGLKNVKCYGSSVAFSNQIRNLKGVTGVTTYVKTNTVEILYNPLITDTLLIQKAIFSPVNVALRDPGAAVSSILEYELTVENFFDPLDATYMRDLLLSNPDIIGFTTSFDCPVRVNIYADASSETEINDIKEMVEKKVLEQKLIDGSIVRVAVNFKVRSIKTAEPLLDRQEYLSRISVKN